MKKRFWTTFLISLLGFSALFGVLGHYVLNEDSAALTEEPTEDDDSSGQDEEVEEVKGEIIFLLMGIDDQNGVGGVKKIKEMEEDENGYKRTNMRTDTMILCKFNYETGEITMASIPRDSRVNIRGRNGQERINHAHSYGGPNLAVKTVKDFLNVNLEYYVTVDYEAVRQIVDAIGGVEIDVPERMYYSDPMDNPPLLIDIQPGEQTLNGDKSLEFLRYRSYVEGDLGRIEAQQLFLKEFINQTLRPRNITKLPTMIRTYFSYVDTNIPITAALKGIPSINDINMDNVKMARLPGVGEYIGPTSYFLPDENEMEKMIEDMFGNFVLSR